MTAGILAGAVVLAAALFTFVNGCGTAGTAGGGRAEAGSTTSIVRPELPPIDLLAPSQFQTASFALG